MMEGNEEAFGAYQSLAMLLEFLSQLENETEVKNKVIKEIEKKAKGYVKDDDQKFSSTHSGYLFEAIKKCQKLRTNILKGERNYKHFTQSFDSDDVSDDQYTELLIDNVFPLFGCLYYMYFECSNGCSFIEGGGKWQSEKCNGGQGPDLKNWLTDETGKTERMISRGFSGIPLSDDDGKKLFPNGSSNALLYYKQGAQLQFALYFMLFLPKKWNRGQSGHALLFLEAFCEKVTGGEEFFKDQKHDSISIENLKSSCQGLKTKISAITKSEIIAPVAVNCSVQYETLLEPEHFSKYMEWIIKTLEELINSLKEMESDVDRWNQEDLKESKTFGPFPWGFVFKDHNWGENWESKKKEQLKQKLNDPLSELTEALTTFRDSIDNAKPIASSIGATIGGVAGTLGAAGAAGAAAYSGILGPAAEALVGTLKTLIF